MVHLGDITKMSGYTIPPVDVITFGSPCQDLSIAGKRAGMAGERSGLFSEAVRIIREMRYATFGAYPKYAVWENVPGAFSSNKGEDFHAVLQSLCRVIDPDAVIPRPTNARGGDQMAPRRGNSGRPLLAGVANYGCPALGRSPTSPAHLACPRSYRWACRRGTI